MLWKNEAMERLRRYHAMCAALENIPRELSRLRADRKRMRGGISTMAVKGGGGRHEDALLDNLMQQQELEWSLKNAEKWVKITRQGLAALAPDEQLVLERLYMQPERNALNTLCAELGVEQSSIYRKRDSALRSFTLALYGAEA